MTRPMLGHFAGAGVAPKRWVAEFRVKGEEGLQVGVGESVGAGWFREGQWVDVRGVGRGMGFAGVSFSSSSYIFLLDWGERERAREKEREVIG